MNLLVKIEAILNNILLKLGSLLGKTVPAPLKAFAVKIENIKIRLKTYLKSLPLVIFSFIKAKVIKVKSELFTCNVKEALLDSYKKALAGYKDKSTGNLSRYKRMILTPFLIVGQWLNGLSAGQSLLLLSLSSASVLAFISIGFSGQKLAKNYFGTSRSPASVEEEILYDRPVYYKKQTRHFDLVSLRLPVYVAEINEVRSVDIDFTATLSNRNSKIFLEKREFQLRDHLILQIEPSVASFPLQEEGKDIIREKLLNELNDFLAANNVEGEVLELKITYVLAN